MDLLRRKLGFMVILVSLLWSISTIMAFSWAGTKENSTLTSEEVEIPEALSQQSIDDLVAHLNDSQVRQLVITLLEKELNRRALERGEITDTTPSMTDKIALLGPRIRFMISGSKALPGDLNRVFQRATEGQGVSRLASLLLYLFLFVLLGASIEWFVRRKTRASYSRLLKPDQSTSMGKTARILVKGLFDLAYLVVFLVVLVTSALIVFHEHGPSQTLIMTGLFIIVAIRVVNMLMVLVFAPKHPAVRFTRLDDSSSTFFLRWGSAFLLAWIILPKLINTFYYFGGSEQAFLFLRTVGGMIIASTLVIMAWQNRKRIIRRGVPSELGSLESMSFFNAKNAPILNMIFIFYVLFLWAISQTELLAGGTARGKVIVSFLIIPAYVALHRLFIHILHITFVSRTSDGQNGADEQEEDEERIERERRLKNYLAASSKVIQVVLAVFSIGFILWLWGIETPFEGRAIQAFFSIFISCMLGYLVWIYTKSAIERKLGVADKTAAEEQSDEPGAGATKTRSQTLLPLLKKFIGVVLTVTVGLIILSSLGVKIAPLLASAGIFGLAIGLGSQALVKDVVAGIFFLIDDVFRVGDYVTIGSEQGSVVKTSLRALTLRHYKGQLQVIPYGDIKSVTNWSRGPMLMKFSLRLPADTNLKKVKKIIKKINKEMMEEEEYGPNLVEPIKSQGVKSIEDGVMSVRVKFRALPGTQFQIKREAFNRIQAALTKAGIPFASRAVMVQVPDELKGKEEAVAQGQTPAPTEPGAGSDQEKAEAQEQPPTPPEPEQAKDHEQAGTREQPQVTPTPIATNISEAGAAAAALLLADGEKKKK
ncbi:MAG: mechanosensitive ion channel family protein [Deltaproteobacteria bacterium]|nr:mechanosensitive ion channel family protein [Deltaproteobacteria bacterium]